MAETSNESKETSTSSGTQKFLSDDFGDAGVHENIFFQTKAIMASFYRNQDVINKSVYERIVRCRVAGKPLDLMTEFDTYEEELKDTKNEVISIMYLYILGI